MKRGGLGSRKPGSPAGSVITRYPTLGLTLYLWGPQASVMWGGGYRGFPKLIRGIKFCDSKKDFVIVFDFSQRYLESLNPATDTEPYLYRKIIWLFMAIIKMSKAAMLLFIIF